MFSGGIERDEHHEMGQEYFNPHLLIEDSLYN